MDIDLTHDSFDDVNVMTIRSDGNVGIGTTSPAGQLHISSGTSGDCTVYIEADTDNNEETDNPELYLNKMVVLV